MLTLFAIIAVAVLIAVVARTEGAKPLGLVMMGVLCIALGGRAAMVLTQNSLGPLLVSEAVAQDHEVSSGASEATSSSAAAPSDEEADPSTPEGGKTAAEPGAAEGLDEPLPALESDLSAEAANDTAGAEITSPEEAAPVLDAADSELPLASDDTDEPVRFITRIEYLTEDRPDWLDSPPSLTGDVHFVSVKAGPYSKVRECLRDLDSELQLVTKEYIDDFVGTKRASTLITYSLDEIKKRLVQGDVFQEKLGTSVGVMNQAHARLKFDRVFRNELEDRWNRIRAGSRLLQTGMAAGIVLLLMGTLFSYFRLDTATKGYFTGRLQFAASAAILTLVAASVLLAKWIPWM